MLRFSGESWKWVNWSLECSLHFFFYEYLVWFPFFDVYLLINGNVGGLFFFRRVNPPVELIIGTIGSWQIWWCCCCCCCCCCGGFEIRGSHLHVDGVWAEVVRCIRPEWRILLIVVVSERLEVAECPGPSPKSQISQISQGFLRIFRDFVTLWKMLKDIFGIFRDLLTFLGIFKDYFYHGGNFLEDPVGLYDILRDL